MMNIKTLKNYDEFESEIIRNIENELVDLDCEIVHKEEIFSNLVSDYNEAMLCGFTLTNNSNKILSTLYAEIDELNNKIKELKEIITTIKNINEEIEDIDLYLNFITFDWASFELEIRENMKKIEDLKNKKLELLLKYKESKQYA